jgi:hypothetical protein
MSKQSEGKAVKKERFIELRAEGLSYEAIAGKLKVSKPTLIAWARELSCDLQNACSLRRDEMLQRFAVAKQKRIEAFGTRLAGILGELDKRELKDVPTAKLLMLALRYGEYLRAEDEPLTLQTREAGLPDLQEFNARVESWHG